MGSMSNYVEFVVSFNSPSVLPIDDLPLNIPKTDDAVQTLEAPGQETNAVHRLRGCSNPY